MFRVASEEVYEDGDIIIEEGGSGDWMYMVLSGQVELSKTVGGKSYVIEELRAGEIFGEVGFFGGIQRAATARAVGDTAVGIIDRTFLDGELNKLPSSLRSVLKTMVKRFKKIIDRASAFSERREDRIPDTLSVTYRDQRSFHNVFTGNISSGGIFIETENPLDVGESFLINLQLPDCEGSIVIRCQVRWIRAKDVDDEKNELSPGMGVKFLEMTERDREILKEYLEDRTAEIHLIPIE